MPILGLLGTEALASERFTNIRREVFYQYPNGAAPLCGLLTMLEDEETNDPEFTWYEKRMPKQTALTATQGATKGPFLTSGGADAGDPLTTVIGTEYRVAVVSTQIFRVGHVVRFVLDKDSSGTVEFVGTVTLVSESTTPKYIQVRALNVAVIKNGTTSENVGKTALVIGSSFAQGATGSSGDIYNQPTPFNNYLQIFRTSFSMTGSALKTALKYDDTGAYKDKAKDHLYTHSIELEKAMYFGRRSKYVDVATGLPTYTTGGIIEALERWESGAVYGNTGATLNSDDEKRIIEINGSINEAAYDGYLERCFRYTNNVTNEKLVLCGSGFLSVINQLYKSKSVLQAKMGDKEQTYGMDVVSHLTPFGTLHYKSHPLFSENLEWRFGAVILDVRNLKYRYLTGRDTELLKERQPNNADYRQDEWLTECGIEIRFPESHMVLKGVNSYTP